MSSARLAQVDRVLAAGIDAGAFPGAAVVIVRRGTVVWERGVGRLGWSRDEPPVSPTSTLYDLASITKVMATAMAVLLLHEDGALSLDDPVGRHLPEFSGSGRATITIRQLLTHQAGLPSGIRLRQDESLRARHRHLLTAPLVAPPGGRPLYSDVGPMVLAFLVERVSGKPLDEFLRRRVYAPAGMRRTLFRPPTALHRAVAPTGSGAARGVARRAVVHDRNAQLLGGVAGHAGLFATARDVATFAQLILNGGTYGGARILSETTAAAFVSRAAGWRALGWSTCHGGGSCGHRLGTSAFGHTGFTGTSVWVDPERELIVVLLTNWVHRPPFSEADPVAVLADVRADIADLAALAIVDGPEMIPMPDQLRVDRAAGWYTPIGP